MDGRKPVSGTTRIYFLRRFPAALGRPTPGVGHFRARLRLIVGARQLRSLLLFTPPSHVKPCCYERSIAGRAYVIEVSPVSTSRWRAQIARLPGMPTSVMPFYGTTPEEAAHALTTWLAMVSAPSPLAPLAPSNLDRPARRGLR